MKGKGLLIALLLLLTAGCGGGRTAVTREYYMLDYAPPALGEMPCLEEILKVERFSVVQLFNSNALVRGTDSVTLSTFPDGRWKANPADLVTDSLVRDFRRAGLFRAVFSYRDPETCRFVLEGSVTEFLEVREEGSRKALLGLDVTLLDLNRPEISRRVVFQKSYSHGAPGGEEGPRGLASGLSRSLAQLSGQIIKDVYQAVQAQDQRGE